MKESGGELLAVNQGGAELTSGPEYGSNKVWSSGALMPSPCGPGQEPYREPEGRKEGAWGRALRGPQKADGRSVLGGRGRQRSGGTWQ